MYIVHVNMEMSVFGVCSRTACDKMTHTQDKGQKLCYPCVRDNQRFCANFGCNWGEHE